MNRKGIVSTADNIAKKARIIFPDLDNNVTYELTVASYVGVLSSGDVVVVAFWGDSMADGAVTAKLEEG